MPVILNRRSFLAVGSATLIGHGSAETMDGASLQVQVDEDTILGQTPADFLGFGYEISSVAVEGLLSPQNHVLVQLYRNLGSEGVVRIGGNTADFATFAANGQAVSAPKSTVINRAVLADLGKFLQATNWKLIWNLNLGSGTLAQAIEQAAAVKELVGDRLLCFQIGNEPDLFFNSGHRPAQYNYDTWYREYTRWSATLKNRLGPLHLAGPDVARETSWVASFAATEHANISLLTDHYYRAGQKQPAATFENLLHMDEHLEDTLQQLNKISGRYKIPYRLVELNSFSGGGKPGVSDTFTSALWALDLMFTLGKANCAGLNLETGVNQLGFVSSYSPIFEDEKGQLTARPSYYAMLAFALAGRGKRLRLKVAGTAPDCAAYAVRSNKGQVWVTLINKSVTTTARIDLSGNSSWSGAQLWHLQAPSFDAKENTTLGGSKVAGDGRFAAGSPVQVAARKARFHLDLKPASAVAMRIQK